MAPLRSLLWAILHSRTDYGALTLLYGARSPELFLFKDELKTLNSRQDMRLLLCADHPATCPADVPACSVAMLPSLVERLELDRHTVVALCGPPAAYPPILKELKTHRLEDNNMYLSLERRMKCGVGRCAHCAVGTLLCCLDGPVFSVAQLQGIEGAV